MRASLSALRLKIPYWAQVSIETRLAKLEQVQAASRGQRSFSTFNGETFVETTSNVFDYRQGLIGANGEWPEFVRDRLVTKAQVDAIERDGSDVFVVRWRKMADDGTWAADDDEMIQP